LGSLPAPGLDVSFSIDGDLTREEIPLPGTQKLRHARVRFLRALLCGESGQWIVCVTMIAREQFRGQTNAGRARGGFAFWRRRASSPKTKKKHDLASLPLPLVAAARPLVAIAAAADAPACV